MFLVMISKVSFSLIVSPGVWFSILSLTFLPAAGASCGLPQRLCDMSFELWGLLKFWRPRRRGTPVVGLVRKSVCNWDSFWSCRNTTSKGLLRVGTETKHSFLIWITFLEIVSSGKKQWRQYIYSESVRVLSVFVRHEREPDLLYKWKIGGGVVPTEKKNSRNIFSTLTPLFGASFGKIIV